MCPGDILRDIRDFFRPPAPPQPTPPPPVAPPVPQAPQTAPTPTPAAPTPSPYSEDESKRKAKITGKKVQKKKRSAGTSQLQTKDKPTTGGLQGINTPQGVNTGTQQQQSSTPPKKTP
jgi:hypothetical protein